MRDLVTFERRLAEAFEQYALSAPTDVDSATLASGLAARHPVYRGRAGLRSPSRDLRLLLVAAVVALAAVASLFASGMWRNDSSPAVTERPGVTELPSTRPPLGGGGNGPILYWDGGSFVRVESDGEQTRLPTLGGHDRSCPTFSPDGRTIAFLRTDPDSQEGQVALAGADGSNLRVLWTGRFNSQTLHQVVWSADGSTVVGTMALDSGGNHVLAYARPGDGSATTLDIGGGEFPGTIALSPDGRRVATIETVAPDASRIDIVEVASGAARTIVEGGAIEALAWSPDGRTIAYYGAGAAPGTADLHLVQPDGADDRVVTTLIESSRAAAYIAWSPDGRRFAVLEHSAEEEFSIRIFDADGNDVGRLGTFTRGSNLAFTWSPSGRSFVVTSGGESPSGFDRPFIATLDGAVDVLEVPFEYYAQCPLGWAPETD